METCFLNHVLRVSLVVLLAVPGRLEARTSHPYGNDMDWTAVTGGYYSIGTTGPEELSAEVKKSFAPGPTSDLRQRLSTESAVSERHTDETETLTEENLATEWRTLGLTETSSSAETDGLPPYKATDVSTEHSSSTIVATTQVISTEWEELATPDQVPDIFSSLSMEARPWTVTEEAKLPRDSPHADLRLGDTRTAGVSTGDAILTDSTYISTTISRAGERTLLSITSSSTNSTSAMYTENSKSPQSPFTWDATAQRTTDADRHSSFGPDEMDTTAPDHHPFNLSGNAFTETDSTPGLSGETDTLTGNPNITHGGHISISEGTPNSTPPLVTNVQDTAEPAARTDQSEVPVSSTPSVLSSEDSPTNSTGQSFDLSSSTETLRDSSNRTHSSTTYGQGESESVPSQTEEESTGLGLTMVPFTAKTSVTDPDESLNRLLSKQPPLMPKTDQTTLATQVLISTSPVTVTHRVQVTEEEEVSMVTATISSTRAAGLPPTQPPNPSSTPLPPHTYPTTITTTPSTTTPNPTSATDSTRGYPRTSAPAVPRRLTPVQTQRPSSTGAAVPTDVSTLQLETSTSTPGDTTAQSTPTTATYRPSTTTAPSPRSTPTPRPTRRHTDRATTVQVATSAPPPVVPPTQPPAPGDRCASNPCMNGGMCSSYQGGEFVCHCLQAWTGPTCTQDVDECKKDPCPQGSKCVNTHGSFNCECPLGFDLEDGRTCTRAKTFLGTFSVNKMPHNPVLSKNAAMHEIHREIVQFLNASLSILQGYSRSTLSRREEDGLLISAVNMFSISSDVSGAEVYQNIQMSLRNCSSSSPHCRVVLLHQLSYHVESLCKAQSTQCNAERSVCKDNSGTAYCQCLQGYYKHNPEDLTCIECGDGFKLENGTCVQCMFGFGGFNCGNFYKLIAVVVSPAGGGLLLILLIALIVTCCKKDKNDINKIIFKSGDLQMSPYAEFPKSNRVSMEWGRETIEMQENGSTKNLLQMTDIYYSPALRNSDLERNGLYPFSGLPGSRHSCIYPAQWNPSFISDDSRRRDYF